MCISSRVYTTTIANMAHAVIDHKSIESESLAKKCEANATQLVDTRAHS